MFESLAFAQKRIAVTVVDADRALEWLPAAYQND